MVKGKYYNLEYLEEISDGDSKFINEMLSEFIQNTPRVINELKRLANEENWNQLHYVAHKFAPSFDFIGAEHIKYDIHRLEECSENFESKDAVMVLIENIGEFSIQVISELKSDFKISEI
jgi:HPt (histidine-containing phosphotransfer) domain-containing protein